MSQRILDLVDGLRDEVKAEIEVLEDENFELRNTVEQYAADKKRLTKQVDHLTEMLLKHSSDDPPCNPILNFFRSLKRV